MNKIQIKVLGTKVQDINKFKMFQNDLKMLSLENKEKLKESIIKTGFNSPIFIWKNKVLDGHQRIFTIKELIKEGYELKNNELPYIEIEAENEQEAGKMILTYSSQYGEMNNLKKFLDDFDLNKDEVKKITTLDFNFNYEDKIEIKDYIESYHRNAIYQPVWVVLRFDERFKDVLNSILIKMPPQVTIVKSYENEKPFFKKKK